MKLEKPVKTIELTLNKSQVSVTIGQLASIIQNNVEFDPHIVVRDLSRLSWYRSYPQFTSRICSIKISENELDDTMLNDIIDELKPNIIYKNGSDYILTYILPFKIQTHVDLLQISQYICDYITVGKPFVGKEISHFDESGIPLEEVIKIEYESLSSENEQVELHSEYCFDIAGFYDKIGLDLKDNFVKNIPTKKNVN